MGNYFGRRIVDAEAKTTRRVDARKVLRLGVRPDIHNADVATRLEKIGMPRE